MDPKHGPLCSILVLTAVAWALVISSGCGSASRQPLLLDQAETARRAAENPANYGTPIRITGVVTYFDPDWRLLFLQDKTSGFFVNLIDEVPDLAVGRLVEVSGRLATSSRGIDHPRFRVLGQASLPIPQQLPQQSDPAVARLSQWVEGQGTIHRASIEDGRLTLTLVDSSGHRTRLRVLGAEHARPITFVGAAVDVAGVSAASVDARGNPNGIQVFVSSLERVRPASGSSFSNPFATKPLPLSSANDRNRVGTLVHVTGTVLENRSRRLLVIGDGNTRITAQISDSYQPGPGDLVEVLAFVSSSPDFNLDDAIVRIVAPRSPLKESQITGALKTVRELKSLSVESASKRLPVEVTGTVTFFDPSLSLLFLQDGTGGVYVDVHNGIPDVEVGDLVRVHGVSGPGDYAPIIAHPTIARVRPGSLPKPLSLSWQTLISGQDDAGWVETVGVVHSVSQLRTQRSFKLVVGGNSYTVQLPHTKNNDIDPDGLLDAQVRIRGVCGAVFNDKRQSVGLKFFVPSRKYVEIIEPAPPLWAIETRPIVSLMRFDPLNLSVHRTKVRGAVTFVDPNQGFFLQDSTAGIYVVQDESQQVRVGQSVEVAGFAAVGPEGPYLRDARIRATGQVFHTSPVRLTSDDLANGSYESQLVTVQGRLLEHVHSPEEDTLFLQVSNRVLQASLQRATIADEIRRTSLLEITGILHNDGGANQNSFRISVSSGSDIRIIEAASWWTPEHIIRTLIVAIIVSLVVLLWISFAAYRVRSYQAGHDLLTGLPNRRAVLEYLDRQLARAIRERSPLAVILADVDHFKKVNDTHGHQAGDAVLKRMAEILRIELRSYDGIGRYGGEEFLIIVPGSDAKTAEDIANRIRIRIFEEPFTPAVRTQTFHVSCSFGIAITDPTTSSIDALLASADHALYAAKDAGRNRVVSDAHILKADPQSRLASSEK